MEIYSPESITEFKKKALQWAAAYKTACYFDSNGYSDPYSAFDVLIAAGALSEIRENCGTAFTRFDTYLKDRKKSWLLGWFSYDLKNETENLKTQHQDLLNFPDLYFFEPQHLILIKGLRVEIHSSNADQIFKQIDAINLIHPCFSFKGSVKSRFSASEYKETVQKIKEHIHRGDIYEVNLCQEFYSYKSSFDPLSAFNVLNTISPTPFSTFFKCQSNYVISATPERFLSKRANKLISQPIKGTVKRSNDPVEDKKLRESLKTNAKEQSENVMIVDLVRNDLTRCAIPGTVKVEELFGIYTFEQVHQMISTVVCEVHPQLNNIEIIKKVFPMGSMTGAPKISAMEIIDKYERSKRGLYSGAIGYFSPEGDFDFNVVIRTILYNANKEYLSYHVGSAITFASDADIEYEECILKAQAITQLLFPQD